MRRVGIRDCEPSSAKGFRGHSLFPFLTSLHSSSSSHSPVLSRDNVDPWRDGGLEPCRLNGRELGFELPSDPPGVSPVRVGTDGFLCVYLPWTLSLSLNESGVEADNEDRVGRDMATDLWDFSRTWSAAMRRRLLARFNGQEEVDVINWGTNTRHLCYSLLRRILLSSTLLVDELQWTNS